MMDRLKDINNKLALTVLTQEKYLLAVTGLQGAGKTKLVKRLYNLDSSYLRDNEGRGEKRPILITESDVKDPVGHVTKSEGSEVNGFNIYSEIVTADEFDRIAKSPSKDEIWLELEVPFQHFYDDKKSFILLLDLKKIEISYSRTTRACIVSFSSSIIVFRKDTFARANNLEMINRVKEIYKDVKPIYVLTHGDVNSENNDEIFEQFMEMLQMDAMENERVVMSGSNQNYFTHDWKNKLIGTIGRYAFLSDKSEENKVRLLEQLFMSVRDEISKLEEFLQNEETKDALNEKHSFEKNTHRLVQQFEFMYERTLLDLERDILESLQGRKEDAVKQFNGYVKENEGTWKGFFNKFTANALKEEEKFQEAIKESWVESGSTTPEVNIINVTTGYINEQENLLKEPEIKEVKESIKENQNRFKLTGLSNKSEELSEIKGKTNRLSSPISLNAANNMTSMQRIEFFFDKQRSSGDIVPLYKNDLKTMTLMGTLLCRQALYEIHLWDQNASELGNQKALAFHEKEDLNSKILDKTVDGMKDFSDKVSGFVPHILKTIPIVLGADFVVDGEADLILHATNALTGIGLAVTPLQLLSVIGGVGTVIYGVNAIQRAVHNTNQRQLKLSRAGQDAISQIPEIQTKAYIQNQRRVFEKMADHLSEVHRERIGENDQDAKRESIAYSLRRIKLVNTQLQKMVYSHAPVII